MTCAAIAADEPRTPTPTLTKIPAPSAPGTAGQSSMKSRNQLKIMNNWG